MTYPTFSGNKTMDLKGTSIDFSSTEYKPPFDTSTAEAASGALRFKDESIKIDLTSQKTISIKQNTLSVYDVVSLNKNPVSASSITTTIQGNKLYFEASSLIYQNSSVVKSDTVAIEGYWMMKTDGTILRKSINTVSVLDGLLMLCQPSLDPNKIGMPYGINLQGFENSIANTELNVDYGAFVLKNYAEQNDGFVYGFYDRVKKEFLGKVLYYVDYVSRGPRNIYIAVMAIDADGNLASSDFLGVKTLNTTIRPPIAPVKMACPIYQVKYVPSSKISISSIPSNLSKFEVWPLYITSGSFVKNFYINPTNPYAGWIGNYSGNNLSATYSTLSTSGVLWSQILGKPFIDVPNEYPTFLSSNKIQLSQTPIASFVEPSSNIIGVLKQYIFIEKRKDINSPWETVSSKLIRNVNCHTGVIDLLVDLPQDGDLVRVTYAVKANGIPIKHVNGIPIPLNPFLNQDNVEPEKPLYIYILPQFIENKGKNIPTNNNITRPIMPPSHVPEYIYTGAIHFTYDNSIFDQYQPSLYNPFAIPIALIRSVNNKSAASTNIVDLRTRGGGVNYSYDGFDNNIDTILKDLKEAISFWDFYPPDRESYPKGGFVIIKIPKKVLENFLYPEEVYSIIRKNITAGVSFKIQDMDGNDWGSV